MARITSYQAQLDLAEQLRRYLHGLQSRLGAVVSQYKQFAGQLYDAGMMDEVHNDFVTNFMAETNSLINSVIDNINERDIPFVNNYMQDLEEQLAKH